MKVEAVRKLADQDAIAKYLGNIVPASEIGPRKNGFDFRTGYGRVPIKPKPYKVWLEKRLASEVAGLSGIGPSMKSTALVQGKPYRRWTCFMRQATRPKQRRRQWKRFSI